jgi:hypothetical protein
MKTRKQLVHILTVATAGIAFVPASAVATPSTTYWAPSVATCQRKYVPHVTYDTYYGKGTPPPGAGAPAYPIDTGLTIDVLPWDKVQAEVGYDVLLPSSDPVFIFLNGKICTPESALFKGSPTISFGIYNLGFKEIDSKLQPGGAKHLWTTQLDIDTPLGKASK